MLHPWVNEDAYCLQYKLHYLSTPDRVPTSSGKPGKSRKKVPCMDNHGIQKPD